MRAIAMGCSFTERGIAMARGLYRVTDAHVATFSRRMHALETRFLSGGIRPGVVLDEIQRLATLRQPFKATVLHDGNIAEWWALQRGGLVLLDWDFFFCSPSGKDGFSLPNPTRHRTLAPGYDWYHPHPQGVLVGESGKITLYPDAEPQKPIALYNERGSRYLRCWPHPQGILVIEGATRGKKPCVVLQVRTWSDPTARHLASTSHIDILDSEPKVIEVNDHSALLFDGTAYWYYLLPQRDKVELKSHDNTTYLLHHLGLVISERMSEGRISIALRQIRGEWLCDHQLICEGAITPFSLGGKTADFHLSPNGIFAKEGNCIIERTVTGGNHYLYRGDSTSDFQVDPDGRIYVVTEKDNALRLYDGESNPILFESDEPFSFVPHKGNAFVIEQNRVLYCSPR